MAAALVAAGEMTMVMLGDAIDVEKNFRAVDVKYGKRLTPTAPYVFLPLLIE